MEMEKKGTAVRRSRRAGGRGGCAVSETTPQGGSRSLQGPRPLRLLAHRFHFGESAGQAKAPSILSRQKLGAYGALKRSYTGTPWPKKVVTPKTSRPNFQHQLQSQITSKFNEINSILMPSHDASNSMQSLKI